MSEETISATPGVVTVSPLEAPKSTKPDDLLDMYAEEEAGEAAESLATPSDTSKQLVNDGTGDTTSTHQGEVIKAKFGDKDISIPKEAKLSVEIDGKSVEVSISDATQALVKQQEFDRNMAKRINTVSRREQATNGAFQNLLSTATKVQELASKGDLLSVNRELAKIASNGSKLDLVTWERKFFDQNLEFAKAYGQLSESQKVQLFKERQAELNESELKRIREQESQREQLGTVQQQVQALQETHQLSPKEFWGTYELMVEELVGEGKDFKVKEDITPEKIAEQAVLNRRVERIYQASKEVGLQNEDIIDEVIRSTTAYPDISTEDIAEFIKRSGVLGNEPPKSAVENLNRKAQKNGLQQKSGNSTKRERNTSGLDQEDLDFLYRKQPKVIKSINYK